MLRHKFVTALVTVIFAFPVAGLCAGSPESTLEEMVFTDKVETVIQHLPTSVGAAWKKASTTRAAKSWQRIVNSEEARSRRTPDRQNIL